MATFPPLTEREMQVMYWTWNGKSSTWIADKLDISKRTVDFHLANIFEKYGVTNKVMACRIANYQRLFKPGMYK